MYERNFRQSHNGYNWMYRWCELREVVFRYSPEIDCVNNPSWTSLWLHMSFVYFIRGNTFTNHLTNSSRKKRRQSIHYALCNMPDITICSCISLIRYYLQIYLHVSLCKLHDCSLLQFKKYNNIFNFKLYY